MTMLHFFDRLTVHSWLGLLPSFFLFYSISLSIGVSVCDRVEILYLSIYIPGPGTVLLLSVTVDTVFGNSYQVCNVEDTVSG